MMNGQALRALQLAIASDLARWHRVARRKRDSGFSRTSIRWRSLARGLYQVRQTTGDLTMTQILAFTVARQRIALLALLAFAAMC
jgi:hypothetical protein